LVIHPFISETYTCNRIYSADPARISRVGFFISEIAKNSSHTRSNCPFEENAKFFNEKAKPAAKHQSNFAKNNH